MRLPADLFIFNPFNRVKEEESPELLGCIEDSF
jgi:hypothetical protein